MRFAASMLSMSIALLWSFSSSSSAKDGSLFPIDDDEEDVEVVRFKYGSGATFAGCGCGCLTGGVADVAACKLLTLNMGGGAFGLYSVGFVGSWLIGGGIVQMSEGW